MPALTCSQVLVERLEVLPKALSENDGKRTVCARDPRFHVTCGNVICTREQLYRVLGAGSDEEAYNKLLSSLNAPRAKLREEEFRDWFVESSPSKIPAVRFYSCDGGPYLTGSVIIACHGGACNASIHRMMRLGEDRFAVRVVERHLHRLLVSAGGRLPAAVVLGAHPLVMLAAASSPPFGVFELNVAASLGWDARVCRTPRYGLPVPCDAGVVVEGVFTGEVDWEGPFTDILLLCDKRRRQPVFRVEAVYASRFDPWVWQVLPGGVEHRLLMGFPREAAIWDYVRRVVDGRVKVRLTPGGGGWLHAVVAVEEGVERSVALNAGLAALAAHPSLKHVVVTTLDVNVDDARDVEWAIATRTQLNRDLVLVPGARGSSLDPSSENATTCKAILLALPAKGREDEFRRPRLIDA